MDYKKIFIVFMVAGIVPIIISALAASFILLDLSLLNPLCWNKVARSASVAWVAFMSIVILIAACNSFD
jgi:hypothetical protein|tara:strand:- start:640 stop:846 length:207 start_codon:yes stop_codon:yes gene_type:complete